MKLRFARWDATRGPRRGTVCLFGGRGEFIEKYFEVVADLRRRGFAVATMDWRGQGGSGRALSNPRKGHVRDFAQYDNDLFRFMKEIVLPDCPPPFTALAHSMGANILIRNAGKPGLVVRAHGADGAHAGVQRREGRRSASRGARLCRSGRGPRLRQVLHPRRIRPRRGAGRLRRQRLDLGPGALVAQQIGARRSSVSRRRIAHDRLAARRLSLHG